MSIPSYGVSHAADNPLVWFRCDFTDKDKAKSVAGARWQPDAKYWCWSLSRRGDETRIIGALRAVFPNMVQATGAAVPVTTNAPLPPVGPPLSELVDGSIEYPWRRVPYAHQREAVSASCHRNRFMVLFEQGLGKTQAAVEAACVALENGSVQRVYMVCPTSLRRTWAEEIAACAWIAPDDIGIVRGNPPVGHPQHLRGVSDQEYRKRIIQRMHTWTALHYEAATLETDILAPLVRDQFLVVDECHALKSPTAKRSKAIFSWNPKRAILQTGTPVVNSPSDIFNAAQFCEPGILGRSLHSFRDRYVVTKPIRVAGGRTVEKEVGYRNLDECQTRLLSIGIRRLKSDCLSLPPKIRHREYCEMSSQQFAAYARMCGMVADELRLQMEQHDGKLPRSVVLSQMVRLQQVTDGYYPDPEHPGRFVWINDAAKFIAADDLVADAVASGRKMLLWTRFVPMAECLAKRYAAHGARVMHGEMGMDDRDASETAFKHDPECKILVLTIGVGGLGLNLQVANCETFFDRWWSPAQNFQCEDRCHRSGQRNQVDIHILLAENTIDEHVDQILRKKEAVADQMTGDESGAEDEEALFDEALLAALLKK